MFWTHRTEEGTEVILYHVRGTVLGRGGMYNWGEEHPLGWETLNRACEWLSERFLDQGWMYPGLRPSFAERILLSMQSWLMSHWIRNYRKNPANCKWSLSLIISRALGRVQRSIHRFRLKFHREPESCISQVKEKFGELRVYSIISENDWDTYLDILQECIREFTGLEDFLSPDNVEEKKIGFINSHDREIIEEYLNRWREKSDKDLMEMSEVVYV